MANEIEASTILGRLPACAWEVPYVGARVPGPPGEDGIKDGANCQRYAYWLLRLFGHNMPPLRSSQLWEDEQATVRVATYEPLDLLLFSADGRAYGAHVGVYLGGGRVLHLCREVGRPAVWTLADFAARPRSAVIVGAKRCAPEHDP